MNFLQLVEDIDDAYHEHVCNKPSPCLPILGVTCPNFLNNFQRLSVCFCDTFRLTVLRTMNCPTIQWETVLGKIAQFGGTELVNVQVRMSISQVHVSHLIRDGCTKVGPFVVGMDGLQFGEKSMSKIDMEREQVST